LLTAAKELKRKLERLLDDPNEALDAATKARIMTHLSAAPFSPHTRTLQEWTTIGASYVGLPHPSKPGETLTPATDLNCAEWHVTKHTAKGEWAKGTTTQEYLDDVRAVILHPSSLLDVGRETVRYPRSSNTRTAPRAAVRTDMAKAKSVAKKATPKPGWTMLSVYAIDTHKLCTAYQLESSKAMATVSEWSGHRTFP
jgi:hypothetical protein